jgi:hypothetical protein
MLAAFSQIAEAVQDNETGDALGQLSGLTGIDDQGVQNSRQLTALFTLESNVLDISFVVTPF